MASPTMFLKYSRSKCLCVQHLQCLFIVLLSLSCVLSQRVTDLSAFTVAARLTSFTDDALGVARTQALYSGAVLSQPVTVDGDTTVARLARDVATRISSRLDAVNRLRDAAVNAYGSGSTSSSLTQCCSLRDSSVSFDDRFNTTVQLGNGCDRISSTASSPRPTISSQITSAAKSNLGTSPEIKFQYYGSEEGYSTIYPGFNISSCSNYDPRYRPWYVASAVPTPLDVVIVVDRSGSMGTSVSNSGGRSRLDLAKEAIDSILTTLSDADRVAIVPFSSRVSDITSGLSNFDCFDSALGVVTPLNIRLLQQQVNRLSASGGTVYGTAIRAAYQRFRNTPVLPGPRPDRVILFLTDGIPQDSLMSILSQMETEAAFFQYQINVLTYALGNGVNSVGINILTRMARQQYLHSVSSPVAVGEYQQISDFNNLRASLSRYYSFFATESTTGTTVITVPYYDAFGLGVILTAASPVYTTSGSRITLRGVVGVDMTISDLFGDITYFADAEHQYAFMINTEGAAVLHPLLAQPVDVSSDPLFQDITLLEPDADFRSLVYMQMRNRTAGQASFVATRFLTLGNSQYEGTRSALVNSSYYWRPIAQTDFIICVVINNDISNEVNVIRTQSVPSLPTVYHRLDLEVRHGERCNQFGRLAISDSSAVKFSPEAFSNPSQYLNVPETVNVVNSYLGYLDGNGANAYFKSSVRDSVRLTAGVDAIWQLEAARSFRRSVVWRYIGTIDGTFRIIPGTQLPRAYDHTRRDWFTRALNSAGEITLSSPYLDAFGSGYVATLSHTITQNQQSSQVNSVGAVMGIDFTMGFLGQTLAQAYPQCVSQFRCLLIDTSGYLVYHPDFVTTGENPEWVHLGRKEPYLMASLIGKGVAQKVSCARYETLQRHVTYRLNTNITSASDTVCGQVSYSLQYVANTNIFVAFLDSTQCSGRSDFICNCPIANSLGVCTLQTASSCECPCVTPLVYRYCTNDFTASSLIYDVCPAEIAGLPVVPRRRDAVAGLEPCFNGTCNSLTLSSDCRATQGCAWCARSSTGAELTSAFCTTDCVCFGGQQGERNPAASCDEVKKNGTDNEKRKETWRIAQFVGTAVVVAVIVPLSIYIQRRRIARRRTLAASQRSSIAPIASYNHRSSAISNQTSRRSEASSASAPPINEPPKYDEPPPDYNVAIQLEFDQPVGAVKTAVNCGVPSTGNHSTFSGSNFTYQSSVNYTCNLGYHISGMTPSNTTVTSTCLVNGSWSRTAPSCQIVDCGTPSTGTQATFSGSLYTYQSSVVYTCNLGYHISGLTASDTTVRSTCLASGLWSQTAPSCQKEKPTDGGSSGRSGLSGGAIGGIVVGAIVVLVIIIIIIVKSNSSGSRGSSSTTGAVSPAVTSTFIASNQRRPSAPSDFPAEPYKPPPASNPNAPPDYSAAIHLSGGNGNPQAAYSSNAPYPEYPSAGQPYPPSNNPPYPH